MNSISGDELPEPARFSKPHLRRMEHEGKFPRRVRLSPFRIAWVEAEISLGSPHALPSATPSKPHD